MKKSKRPSGWILLVLCVSIWASSCGYQLVGVGGRGIYGGEITSVSLPAFKNNTYEPHASLYVTESFSQELLTMGLFDLNKEGADAYVQGTIRRVNILPSSMNASGIVIQKQATMDVELALYRKDGTFIKRWVFTDSEPYDVADVQAEDFNKRNAFQIISGRMARKFSALLLVEY